MRAVWLVAGVLLLLAGLAWMVYIVGGVFSQADGFTNLSGLWGALGFHAVAMALGTFCFGKAVQAAAPRTEVA